MVPRVNTAVPDDQNPLPNLASPIPEYLQNAVDGLVFQLERSVMLQVQSITSLKCVNPSPRKPFSFFPRKHHGEASVAVLYSGGIDSAVLALLADR